MTCMLSDADLHMTRQYGRILALVAPARTILYADDTLIVESESGIAQEYMGCIRELGS